MMLLLFLFQVNDEGRLCQTDARLTMGDPNSCTNDGVFKMPTLMPARVQVRAKEGIIVRVVIVLVCRVGINQIFSIKSDFFD